MRIGLYPGTFDPLTLGHIDIITRASSLVDQLVIGVAINNDKNPLFTLNERVELIEKEGLIGYVRDVTAPYLANKIQKLDSHPLVGETRSFGLLACVEIVKHKSGPVLFDPVGEVGMKCRDHAINNGLMVRAVRDGMILSPPLTFKKQDIEVTLEKLQQALDTTYSELIK